MATSELDKETAMELKAEDNEDTGELIDEQPDRKTEVDLDLYADVEANEFSANNQGQQQAQDNFEEQNQPQIEVDLNIADDGVIDDTGLYDDVMAEPNPNTSNDFASESDKSKPLDDMGQSNGKRVSCYVGNLNWWTTDKCLTEAIASLGCTDIIDIKFYENKVNGQSKGFALVTLGSEQSFRLVMEKLAKQEINGQEPVVTPFSRHYFNQFEEQARKDMPQSGQNGQNDFNMNRNRNFAANGNVPQIATGLPLNRPVAALPGASMMMNRAAMPNVPGLPVNNFRPNQPFNVPRPNQPMFNHASQNQGLMGNRPPVMPASSQSNLMARPGGPSAPGILNNPRMPMNSMGRGEWENRNPISGNFQANGGMMPNGCKSIGMMNQPRANLPSNPMQPFNYSPNQSMNGAMMNPNVPFAQSNGMAQPNQFGFSNPNGPMMPSMNQSGMMLQTGPNSMPIQNPNQQMSMMNAQMQDAYGYRPGSNGQYGPIGMGGSPPIGSNLSDAEFQETLEKNRIISSSAISRAVQDAAIGEYGSAIKTLVTAISLIKQSKIAGDERCKLFISSLQDTKKGIEDKYYGSSGRMNRSDSRDRERSKRSRSRDSRDRDHHRDRDSRSKRGDKHHRSHRDRSRERSRNRSRERSRDKSHDRGRDRRIVSSGSQDRLSPNSYDESVRYHRSRH